MSTYTPEEYTMTITASTKDYDTLADQYAKMLAESMQRTKDAVATDLYNSIFIARPKRLTENNPYIHGALNAIRKQTETL